MKVTTYFLAKSIGILKVASQLMPREILVSMFHAFVMSHILYGVFVWEKHLALIYIQ